MRRSTLEGETHNYIFSPVKESFDIQEYQERRIGRALGPDQANRRISNPQGVLRKADSVQAWRSLYPQIKLSV
jgi:hypothetical protein